MKKVLFLFIALISLMSCEYEVTLGSAGIIADDFVKERLNFPAEAEFEWSYVGDVTSDSTFTVYNQFTAKNAFGVRSTYVYKAKMVYLGGEWTDINNWTYTLLLIENSSTRKQAMYFSPNDK